MKLTRQQDLEIKSCLFKISQFCDDEHPFWRAGYQLCDQELFT